MAVSEEKSNREQDFISVRLDKILRDRLAELAERNERSMSAEVRIAIREHLERAA